MHEVSTQLWVRARCFLQLKGRWGVKFTAGHATEHEVGFDERWPLPAQSYQWRMTSAAHTHSLNQHRNSREAPIHSGTEKKKLLLYCSKWSTSIKGHTNCIQFRFLICLRTLVIILIHGPHFPEQLKSHKDKRQWWLLFTMKKSKHLNIEVKVTIVLKKII